MGRLALNVEASNDSGFNLFANGAYARYVSSTEYYRILQLEVNCGIHSSILQEDTEEIKAAKAAFNMSVPFIRESVISLSSPDGTTIYYTIDLHPIIPEGWSISVERLTNGTPFSFGLLIAHPDHLEETAGVHRFTNTDYRAAGMERCENLLQRSYIWPGPIQCEREAGHLGNHQGFDGDAAYNWSEGATGGNGNPHGEFGFKNICPHCGFVSAGGATGKRICSTCSYWFDQHKHGGGFVIDGKHYRPGAGGFGGTVFHIQRHNGTKWTGELFTQGTIPSWMSHLFPNNAVFIDK